MPGFDDMTHAQMAQLSPEDMDALGRQLDAGEPEVAAQPQPAAEPAPEVAAEPAPADPAAEAQAAQVEQQQRRGDPEVPLRQAREELRQMRQFVNDPAAVANYLAQQGFQVVAPGQQQPAETPDFWENPEAAVKQVVQQATAPLEQQIQQQGQYIQQLEGEKQHTAEVARLSQQYGADAPQLLSQFDQMAPNLANTHPELKVLAMKGLAANDPAAKQAEIQAAAEKLMADKLANLGGKQPPVTLGGLPPAKGNEPEPDIANMTQSEFDKLSDAQISKYAQRM